ncbi:glycosyltransferase [Candidatus Micrarchaeota archaeon]|nr:glycosyltransferase [Candidatus Micrarchaeota archaeon]
MRIAFFTDTYHPNVDGVVMMMDALRASIERLGHEVFIFAPGTGEDIRKNTDDHVYYFKGVKFPPYPSYKLALWPFSSLAMVKQLNIDVIHSHGVATTSLAALLAGKLYDIPTVATYHTKVTDAVHYVTGDPCIEQFLRRAIWAYLERMYSQYDLVTCPSKYIQRLLKAHGIESVVIPNGIDISRFRPTTVDKRIFGLDDESKVILHVGRIVKEKNLDIIIRSLPLIPSEYSLVIIGHGPAESYYRKLTEKYRVSDRVKFLGFVPNNELPAYYSSADVFVFASRFDTQGLVALEALACGTPIAGLKGIAIEEIVRPGLTGYLFDEDPLSVRKAIVSAAELKRRHTSEQIRYTALAYSRERMTESFLYIYRQLIEKKKRSTKR